MRFSFLVLAFVALVSSAHPNSVYYPRRSGCHDIGNSRLYGGGQAYYYHLKIVDDLGVAARATPNPFTGWVGGFILGYEYKKPNSLYAVLQTSYALGSIESHDTGNNKRFIHDELLETRIGYDGALTRDFSWFVTPYTGAGFRWNSQYRYPGTLPDLKCNYYKIYIPLGLLINYIPNQTLNIGLDFEWMPDVLSMVSFSSLPGSFWELKRKNNYLVQLPCMFTFARRYELSLTPFWMHFEEGDSTTITNGGVALGLEKQRTNDWGARVSLGVYF